MAAISSEADLRNMLSTREDVKGTESYAYQPFGKFGFRKVLNNLSIAGAGVSAATRNSLAMRRIQLGFLNGATSICAAFSAARMPRAISTAPGVSPWMQTVSVRILITLP